MGKITKTLLSPELVKRYKSFAWSIAAMVLAFAIQIITEKASDLQISNEATVVLGLVIAQITKYINNKQLQ